MKAINNFVAVVGDKAIADISGDDMLEFRQWWIDKIDEERLTANSATKDLTPPRRYAEDGQSVETARVGVAAVRSRREGRREGIRPPSSNEWIKGKLLAPGVLAGLNTEARCIVLGMVNTGYRPSEGTGLLREHIRLDTDVPHIAIGPDGRQLKSAHGWRVIPLAGVSPEAFKQCPEGFPTYRCKDKIGNTANKYLRENNFLETSALTLYGLRHSFEDRMLAAGVDDRIRRDLFGHGLTRERYGQVRVSIICCGSFRPSPSDAQEWRPVRGSH